MRDSSLISQIQIALIGIVVVFGMFYVWRRLARIEERIDHLSDRIHGGSCLPGSNTCAAPGWSNEDFEDEEDVLPDEASAEELLRQVFGYVPETPPASTPIVEEEAPAVAPVTAEVESEAETDAMDPLSKSKLRRMNLDTLKHLCEERGLSTEGSKTVLTDRLLGIVRE